MNAQEITSVHFGTNWAVEQVTAHTGDQGLAFVPDIVRQVKDPHRLAAMVALVAAAKAGYIELRPDSGLGRFTFEEIESAPAGPQGSRLFWARVLP